MSNIPEARRALIEFAERLAAEGAADKAAEVRAIVDDFLFRRPAAQRMPPRSRPITSEVVAEISELAGSTDLLSAEIAHEVGVNPGRVSEVLQGDRG